MTSKKYVKDRICITGIGIVSPIGIGKEEFLSSLEIGKSGIEEIKEFNTDFSSFEKRRSDPILPSEGFHTCEQDPAS